MLAWRDVRIFILFLVLPAGVLAMMAWQYFCGAAPAASRIAGVPAAAFIAGNKQVNPVVQIDPTPPALWTNRQE